MLDAAGGTDILHVPAGRLILTAGADALRCISFSGKVLRWYADCCRTPLANTASSARFPVVALIHSFMDCEGDRRARDALLGRPLCRIYEHSAIASLPQDAPPPPSSKMYMRRAFRILRWWMLGLGGPNPFFDSRTGAAVSEPRLLAPGGRLGL